MNMSDAVPSMRKTTRVLAAAAGLAAVPALLALVLGRGAVAGVLAVVLLAAAAVLGFLAWSGQVTQERQRRVQQGGPDLFLQRNACRSEQAVGNAQIPAWSGLRRALARSLFGHPLMVGDLVRVKPLAAIRATLDAQAQLEGLPFMDEMAAFCGRTLRVYRVLDKVYDYGRSKLMRRLDDCVLLIDLRCDGSAHDRCEAECYLIWKAAWLEPADAAAPVPEAPPAPPITAAAGIEPGTAMSCQYTRLTEASRPMHALSLHGILGPLAVGNVSFGAFLVALGTRCFNDVHARRGGAAYPYKPPPSDDKTIRGESLKSGDWVRVKLPDELSRAMDRNSKNRGLWFDRDMLKHAGQVYRVRGRVDRLIDVNSGKMITVKTPCITLEEVHATGEFQSFGEQHDFLYWREAWLLRLDGPPAGTR